MTTAMISRKKTTARADFGWVRLLPSGRFQASYTGLDGARHKAPKTFDTKTDAKAWLAIQRASMLTGSWDQGAVERAESMQSSTGIRFATYAQDWVDTRIGPRGDPLTPRTRKEYQGMLNGSLAFFADMRLNMITPATVRAWNRTQLATGRKTHTAHSYSLLRSILHTAVVDKKIGENPCVIRGASNSRTGRKVLPPTGHELTKLVNTITDKYRAMVIIAAWGACRWGEVTELRRSDIQIAYSGATPVIVAVGIERAVTQTVGIGFVVGKVKGGVGERAVVMPPHVNAYIQDHLDKFVGPEQDALLFPGEGGHKHLSSSTFAKHWQPARASINRRDLSFHALRHYGATKYAQTGATLMEIQARLGHTTVAAAMRYQHAGGVDGRDAALAARMSAMAIDS